MRRLINIYTYSIASIVLFGVGLISIVGFYPAHTTQIKAIEIDSGIYTAVSIDYSTLDIDYNLS